VYAPEDVIVPPAEFPPSTPFTYQSTAVYVVPIVVASNAYVCLAKIEDWGAVNERDGCETVMVVVTSCKGYLVASAGVNVALRRCVPGARIVPAGGLKVNVPRMFPEDGFNSALPSGVPYAIVASGRTQTIYGDDVVEEEEDKCKDEHPTVDKQRSVRQKEDMIPWFRIVRISLNIACPSRNLRDGTVLCIGYFADEISENGH